MIREGCSYHRRHFSLSLTIPMFLEKLHVFPAMTCAREDSLCPLRCCGVHVIFDYNAMNFLELRAEYRIGEANRHAYVVRPEKRVIPALECQYFLEFWERLICIPIVHVGRSPSENVGIQCHEQRREASLLRSVENRYGDVVL